MNVSDVRIAFYNTIKGEVCTIKFAKELKQDKFCDYRYMKLDIVSDRIYFFPTNDSSGLKFSDIGLIQLSKKSTVEIVKCFEGSYDLETDVKRQAYYIDFNNRKENAYSSNYGTGTAGNRTNHNRSYDASYIKENPTVTLEDISEDIKAFRYPKFEDTKKEPDNKPYAAVKKKPHNNDTVLALIGLAINQLDNNDVDLARSSLVTLRELLKGDK